MNDNNLRNKIKMVSLHDLILSAYDQVDQGMKRVDLEKEGYMVKAHRDGTTIRIDIKALWKEQRA